jgi:gamma-glutamyltranspeptidase/glutathione hydrolase
LKSDNSAPREGEIIQNKDYAYTLEEIAKYGANTFYSGDLGRLIIDEIDKNFGFLTKDDLLKYKAIWREPSHFNYNGLDILTTPPPSSGSLVFSGLEALTLENKSHSAHQLLADAMLKMFSKRRRNFGDPAFTSIETASESPETTSLCTIDSAGNAACLTYSNNNHSGVVIPDTGILMNNSMALFSPWPDNPNAVMGGKRPISSMMPTLLFKNGKIKMAIGASGSTRIPTSLMQVLYRLTVEKKSIKTAISEPKLHAEAEIMMSDEDLLHIAKPLAQQMGLKYVISPGRDTSMGVVQAIHIDQENITTAIGDPRAKACGMVL